MSGDDPCTCNWFEFGLSGPWHEPNPDCPIHFPDPVPEIFPGTLAALDALTIRKATPCESKK